MKNHAYLICYDTTHYFKPEVISNINLKSSQYANYLTIKQHNKHCCMSLFAFNQMLSLQVKPTCTCTNMAGHGIWFYRNLRKCLFVDWQTRRAYGAQSGRHVSVINYWSWLCCHSSCQTPPPWQSSRNAHWRRHCPNIEFWKQEIFCVCACMHVYECVCVEDLWKAVKEKKSERAAW